MYKNIIINVFKKGSGFVCRMRCLDCKNTFFINKYRAEKGKGEFCSKKCYDSYQRKYPHTKKLTGVYGKKHPRWKGGKYISKFGYVYIYKPEYATNPRGYIKEHRYLVEQKIGRRLREDEVIHHVNGDKLDNRLENLEIINPAEHFKKYHGKDWKKRVDKDKLTGLFCTKK